MSNSANQQLSKAIRAFLWLFFFVNCFVLILSPKENLQLGEFFVITNFTFLIWTVVSFFSAIVVTYASNYLKGFRYYNRFLLLCLGFTLSVMGFVISNHVLLFIMFWLLMGVFMSKLIGVDLKWGEAREASKIAQKFFLAGTILLGIGISILVVNTNEFLISGITQYLDILPKYVTVIASLFIITASLIQSAIYPFHRWLLSAMTSPTPASALMHAGFVNGSGILLALFATLLFSSNTLSILFVTGGLTAIIAQFTKLLQVNVKQRLACSTIAQMGFMIMQCGLGFFNAAIAHLILHGFYKAYLFLNSGEEIKQAMPQKPLQIKIKPLQVLVVLIFGGLGAYMFIFLTGKQVALDNSIFLTIIVAITVGQAAYNIVKERSLAPFQKLILSSVLFIIGIGIYALVYNGVTFAMSQLPMPIAPLKLTAIEIGFGVIFLIGFFIMKLGFYRQVPWLYVKLLNASQPYKATILKYKKS